MNEPFDLVVPYEGAEYEFKARFERWGYTHRIAVLIDEATLVFEPDEEGGYRALSLDPVTLSLKDIGLLKAIAEKLSTLSK